jgi:2-polyprenyl-6-methoxyphenol hydroxylase-like FAD-dependent oxidoreductase
MAAEGGKSAIVIGAGIGGLAAAAALAPHFGEILILERDHPAPGVLARSGVPHGAQAHVLLLGAQQALAALLPGFEADLEAAGAVPLRQSADSYMDFPRIGKMTPFDIGLHFLAASRPLIEAVVRRRVAGLANVTIRAGVRVEALVTSPEGDAVLGVRHAGPGGAPVTLAADLVIDAAGRNGTLSRDMLAQTGREPLAITEIGIEVAYTTGIFTTPEDAARDWKYAYVMASPPADTRSGLILPIEGGRWLVTMVGRFGDRPPADHAGFLEFARGLRNPILHQALQAATPEGKFARFVTQGNTWRHFERLPAPRGWLPLGDTISDLNPVYGQGMAVAAQEAAWLRRRLDEGGDLAALPAAYLAGLAAIIAPAWSAALSDLGFPQTTGERPPDFAERQRFSAAIAVLAAREPEMRRLWTEVTNLQKPPSVFQAPALRARIGAVMAEMAARA